MDRSQVEPDSEIKMCSRARARPRVHLRGHFQRSGFNANLGGYFRLIFVNLSMVFPHNVMKVLS